MLLRYPNESKRRLVDQKHKGKQTYPRGLPDKGKRHWYEIVPDLPNEGFPTIGNGAEFPNVKDPACLQLQHRIFRDPFLFIVFVLVCVFVLCVFVFYMLPFPHLIRTVHIPL